MSVHPECSGADEARKSVLELGVARDMHIQSRIARIYLTGLRREEGQTMTEYGVLLALIAVVVIAALLILGPKIATLFQKVANQL
jgi:pilus assembly protein Flp/PilA